MIKDQLTALITAALEDANKAGELSLEVLPAVTLEMPKNKEHGDWATSVALSLAAAAKKKPRDIAELIVARLPIGGTSPIARAASSASRVGTRRYRTAIGSSPISVRKTYGSSITSICTSQVCADAGAPSPQVTISSTPSKHCASSTSRGATSTQTLAARSRNSGT